MTIYGANLGNLALPGSKSHGTERGSIGKWWCPTCELLVTSDVDPISCDDCDGDMTIAPQRVQNSCH